MTASMRKGNDRCAATHSCCVAGVLSVAKQDFTKGLENETVFRAEAALKQGSVSPRVWPLCKKTPRTQWARIAVSS